VLSNAGQVDYDYRDVVLAAVPLGQAGQFASRLLSTDAGFQYSADRRFVDMGGEPVGAKQQTGAGEGWSRMMSGSTVAAMPMARVSKVALRVVPPLLRPCPAGLDEALDDAVVAGQLAQLPAGVCVGAGVADAHDHDPRLCIAG